MPLDVLSNRSDKKHWRVGARESKLRRETAALTAHGLAPVQTPCTILVVRRYSGRRRPMDRDNVVAGAKPMIDGLVDAGMIPGDTEADVVLIYAAQERVAPSEAGTLLELRTADPGCCPMCGTPAA